MDGVGPRPDEREECHDGCSDADKSARSNGPRDPVKAGATTSFVEDILGPRACGVVGMKLSTQREPNLDHANNSPSSTAVCSARERLGRCALFRRAPSPPTIHDSVACVNHHEGSDYSSVLKQLRELEFNGSPPTLQPFLAHFQAAAEAGIPHRDLVTILPLCLTDAAKAWFYGIGQSYGRMRTLWEWKFALEDFFRPRGSIYDDTLVWDPSVHSTPKEYCLQKVMNLRNIEPNVENVTVKKEVIRGIMRHDPEFALMLNFGIEGLVQWCKELECKWDIYCEVRRLRETKMKEKLSQEDEDQHRLSEGLLEDFLTALQSNEEGGMQSKTDREFVEEELLGNNHQENSVNSHSPTASTHLNSPGKAPSAAEKHAGKSTSNHPKESPHAAIVTTGFETHLDFNVLGEVSGAMEEAYEDGAAADKIFELAQRAVHAYTPAASHSDSGAESGWEGEGQEGEEEVVDV